MSAVGAIGREAVAGEGELEEIRVVRGAEPAEEVELEVAFEGVGEKSGLFERAKFEVDADAAPLVLQSGGDQAGLLVG